MAPSDPIRRIAVTGGPGAGKTTVLQRAGQTLAEQIVAVPEVATLMHENFFPRVHSEAQRRAIQRAIFHTQLSLEDFHDHLADADRPLLCDRGTPDGGGYWPAGPDDFFTTMGTTLERELSRYEAVIFLESAAVGGLSIDPNNPTRVETLDEAVEVDRRLREVWSGHGRFIFVPHTPHFEDKLAAAMDALQACLRAPA